MTNSKRFIPQYLKKYANVQGGYAFKSSEFQENGIPIIRIGDIKNNRIVTENCAKVNEKYLSICKNYIIQNGDILIAMTGATVGKIALNTEKKPLLLNQRVGRFIHNTNILPKYLYYVLLSDAFYNKVQYKASGAGQPNISPTEIGNIRIPVPPSLEEQQEIVDVLDAADRIIRLRTACIESAQSLIPALFQEMFGDVVDNKTMSPIYNLGDVADFVRGPFGGSLKKEIFVKEGYWVYEQYHAINNDFSKARYFIDDKKFNEMKRFEVYPGDILISCSGTMGKIAIVPDDYHKGIINQALLKLSVHNDVLNNIFLKYLLLSEYYQNKYFRNQPGAAIQNVRSVSVLKNIKIILPTIQQQKNFVDKVQEIEAYIKTQQAELENAKTMFQSLLHHSFTGELTRRAYGE